MGGGTTALTSDTIRSLAADLARELSASGMTANGAILDRVRAWAGASVHPIILAVTPADTIRERRTTTIVSPAARAAAVVGDPVEQASIGVSLGGKPWGTIRIDLIPRAADTRALARSDSLLWVGATTLAFAGLAIFARPVIARARSRPGTSAAWRRTAETLNFLAEGVLVLDRDERIVFVNARAESLLGASLDTLRGTQASNLRWSEPGGGTFTPAWLDPACAADNRFMRCCLEHPDGRVRTLNVGVRGVTRGRENRGWLITLDDVSELEERGVQLAAACDAAEAATKAKSEFLANMSHEIRTPINGVTGSLELLTLSSLQPSQAEYVRTARQSASALLHLINDILDFSKIEAGKLELSPIAFELSACADDAIGIVRHAAAAKGLSLAMERPPSEPIWLHGDRDRLRQVLLNLLNNAIKFTACGGVTLRYGVSRPVAGHVRVNMAVIDTGMGIPPDRLDRLFRSFSQVDASHTRTFGGTGLGLAICKQLCRAMNGGITVESVPGHGSAFKFHVILPLAAAEIRSESPALDAAGVSSLRGMRVLVVEDHAVGQMVTRGLLESLEAACEIVARGDLALQAVQTADFHAVLMDGHLPGCDGFEATRRIREWERTSQRPPIPIIGLSAAAMVEDRKRGADAGMSDYLTKPFTRASLAATLAQHAGAIVNRPHAAEISAIPATPVTPPAAADSPIDLPALRDRCMKNDDLLRDLLALFRQSAADDLARLESAAARGNRHDVTHTAHAIAGAALQVEARDLAALARMIEHSTSTDLHDLQSQIDQLRHECSRCDQFVGSLAHDLASDTRSGGRDHSTPPARVR